MPPCSVGANQPDEFYDTTLPASDMVPGPFSQPPDPTQKIFFNQSYEATGSKHAHPKYGGDNRNTKTVDFNAIIGRAKEGSGGSFLSNEIFYRVAHRRETLSSSTLTGHLHVPAVEFAKKDYPSLDNIDDIITEVEDLLKRWLDSLP